jgi:hypothetical protein
MAPVLPGEQQGDWQVRLAQIVELVQEMSRQADPQEMVRSYGERVRVLLPSDRRISLSRRGLTAPKYRIARSTTWAENINPWKEKERLPLFEGGLIAKLIYGDEPQIIDNLDVPKDDPAADYLAGHRSLMAIPVFDQGVALNMVILLRKEPAAFPRDEPPHGQPRERGVEGVDQLGGVGLATQVLFDQLGRGEVGHGTSLRVSDGLQNSHPLPSTGLMPLTWRASSAGTTLVPQ